MPTPTPLSVSFGISPRSSIPTTRNQGILTGSASLSRLTGHSPTLRTAPVYDVKYQDYWNRKWKLASEASNGTAFGDDWENRESLLSILYIQRRHNMKNPGLGDHELARLLCKPLELVEFHVWYLKAKGWVERLDTGQLAISALGVDQVEQGRLRLRKDRLLTAGGTLRGRGRTRRPVSAQRICLSFQETLISINNMQCFSLVWLKQL